MKKLILLYIYRLDGSGVFRHFRQGVKYIKKRSYRRYNMDKYEGIKRFILENFETTENKWDRLHTQDIINIMSSNGFRYSTARTAQVIKSMGIGEYKPKVCSINGKTKAGYIYLKFKGET